MCRVRLTGLEISSFFKLYINSGELSPNNFYDGYFHCSTRRDSGKFLTLTCVCYCSMLVTFKNSLNPDVLPGLT